VTLWIDGASSLTYLFDSTLNDAADPDSGYIDPLGDGYLGLGSVESVIGTTGFRVQVPTPPITLSVTDTFEGSTNLLAGSGSWQLDAGGFDAVSFGAEPAVATVAFEVAPSALLELETTLETTATGGVVFDVYGPRRFKFIAVSAATSELLIGHYTSAGWVIDASTPITLDAGAAMTLRVALLGNIATVWLDDVKVATHSFNSLLIDGDVGLVARDGSVSFGSLTMRTDDPDLRGDGLPSASIGDAAVVEGDSGTRTVTVSVSLSEASTRPVTIGYTTSGDSATGGIDYLDMSGTISFSPGDTVATITMTILGDTEFEGNETFRITLGTAQGAVVVDGIGVVTITNDDAATLPTVTATPSGVVEGDSGTTALAVTLTLSEPSADVVTVEFRTSDGRANGTVDFVGASGVATFAPGVTEIQVVVDIVGDTLYEADETLVLILSNATGAVVGTTATTLTIVNDDAAPVVSIAATDPEASEAGSDPAIFMLGRTVNLTGDIIVALGFAGAAAFGVDYTVSVVGGTWDIEARTVSLADGVSSATITITPLDDVSPEGAEDVIVSVLTDPGYDVLAAGATASIEDNDQAMPGLSIGDVSIVEGDVGGTFVTLRVTLSVASTDTVTATIRTVEGTAEATEDFRAYIGTIKFAPGVTTVDVKIRVYGDRLREGDEQFFVEISNPTGAAIIDGVATVTIVDNDGALMVDDAPMTTTDEPDITTDAIDPVLVAAMDVWVALGIDPDLFSDVTIVVTDLADLKLAEAQGNTIYIDGNAAGWGWFVDSTPGDMDEFTKVGQSYMATASSEADRKIDLLTVLVHELGHMLGLEHDHRSLAMEGVLGVGTRRLPDRWWSARTRYV
ncbi:MAG: Calx-beta domain-containing protein, partial [Actinomycetota bacterium]|nr:Calx-beta domain-containing protein [Actinomycetota bacterium]